MLIFFIVKMLLVGEAHCDVMEDLLKSVRTLNDKVDHVRFELATTNTKVNQLQDDLKSQNVEMTENLESLWLRIAAIENWMELKKNEDKLESSGASEDTWESSGGSGDTWESSGPSGDTWEESIETTTSLIEDTISRSEQKVILVTGGNNFGWYKSWSKKQNRRVEALKSDGTPLCSLNDLPDERYFHSIDGNLLCGGEKWEKIAGSCLHYEGGKWIYTKWNLTEKRKYHTSWERSDGSVQLMGGYDHDMTSWKTTEILTKTGSKKDFDLKYGIGNACAINTNNDYVMITGGFDSKRDNTTDRVRKYDVMGWIEDLPNLNHARRNHGCGYYWSNNNFVYLVAGGLDTHGYVLSSAETLSKSDSWTRGLSWSFIENLPSARYHVSSITVNNEIFMTGGTDWANWFGTGQWKRFPDVLKYDQDAKQWLKIGNMSVGREGHALTVLPLADVEPYCI